jgi:hypothetical protein
MKLNPSEISNLIRSKKSQSFDNVSLSQARTEGISGQLVTDGVS